MEQYAVPQFIETEGKIIYFLTFRQFFVLVGGGILSGACYYILPLYFFAIASLLIMGMAAAIAFVKVKNDTILTIFLNFMGFTLGTKNYVWQKKDMTQSYKIQKAPEGKNDTIQPTPLTMQSSKLKQMKTGIETKRVEVK